MATDEAEIQAQYAFVDACERLAQNDPGQTCISLRCRERIAATGAPAARMEILVNAFARRRMFLETLQISPPAMHPVLLGLLPAFIQSSKDLRRLVLDEPFDLTRRDNNLDLNNVIYNDGARDALLVAAAHCTSLKSMRLHICMRSVQLMPYFLRHATLSCLQIELSPHGYPLRMDRAEMIRDGLEQNTCLETLELATASPALLGWILPGLYDHSRLRRLTIDFSIELPSAWDAVPDFLKDNSSLQELNLTIATRLAYNPTPLLKALKGNRSLLSLSVSLSTTEGDETNFELPEEDAHVWLEMLRENDCLQELKLKGCIVLETTSAALAAGLAANSGLRSFGLVQSELHPPDDSMLWTNMLHNNVTLKKLNLSESMIGSSFIECLALGLACNTALQELVLSDNAVCADGLQYLANALRTNKTLQALILNACEIEGIDAPHALRDLLLHNSTLQRLDLSDNDAIGYTGGPLIAQGVAGNSSLKELNLCGNIFPHDAAVILEAFSQNQTLHSLNLSEVLAAGGEHSTLLLGVMQGSTLQSLVLNSNALDTRDIEMLSLGLRTNVHLRELFLSWTGIQNDGLAMLGDSLTENQTLERLDVTQPLNRDTEDRNHFDAAGVCAFIIKLPRMKGLRFLHGLVVDDEDTAAILAESLSKNTILEEFSPHLQVLPEPSPSKGLVDFYLQANRRGRKLLKTRQGVNVPFGLWASILAQVSSLKDIRFLYCLLQQKPELMSTV